MITLSACVLAAFPNVCKLPECVKRKMVSNQKLGIDLPRLDVLSSMGVLKVSTIGW